MCSICGQPGYIRCNCVSAQSFCDQCDSNSVCIEKMDSQCVIYHLTTPTYTPPATRLINLNLPNDTPVETILEKIDSALGFAKPWIPGDTNTLHLFTSGPGLPIVLKGDVKVSATSGNTLVAKSDGLYVSPFVSDGKVKVDSAGIARYLEDSIVGGTDGCVSITPIVEGGLLGIIPTLDLACLADKICLADSDIKSELGSCLISSALSVEDTASVDLDLDQSGIPIILKANVNISSASGNTLVINSDGLYTTGGVANANNGLSVFGGNTIQLGGALIKDTTIDFASLYQLNFTNSPLISIGSSTSIAGSTTMFITDANTASPNGSTLSTNLERNLSNSVGYLGANSFLKILGGPFTQTQTTYNNGLGGQLWLFPTGDLTLFNSDDNSMSGVYGVVIKSGTNNISGSTVSGGHFGGYAANSGNVSDMAGVKIHGIASPPTSPFGPAFTGTVTNYYGVKIEDIAGSTYGSRITNKFAIYQVGTTDVSRFFGPVQNAGGTTQFTSDERVKENISIFNRGLNEIEQIDTHTFNYVYNKDTKVTGIIAQELEQIIPEAVKKGNFSTPDNSQEFSDFRMVDQNVIFYTMLNAIKELSSLNKNLSARVAALENK